MAKGTNHFTRGAGTVVAPSGSASPPKAQAAFTRSLPVLTGMLPLVLQPGVMETVLLRPLCTHLQKLLAQAQSYALYRLLWNLFQIHWRC